jgi:hypothetical protein
MGWRLFLSFIFFFLLAAGSSQADPGKQFIAKVNGRIAVSADGVITELSLKNVTSAPLRDFLESRIKKWEFHPMTVNGQPVAAEAGFNFLLIASYKEDGKLSNIVFRDVVVEPTAMELKAQRAKSNNPENDNKRVAPRYPEYALREGAQATVEVVVKIAPDGSILKADPYSVALIGVGHKLKPVDVRFLTNQFTQSAVVAIKKWRFAKTKLATDACLSGCVSRINVEYVLGGGPWFTFLEVETPKPAWLVDENILPDITNPKSQLVRFKQQPSNQPIDLGG